MENRRRTRIKSRWRTKEEGNWIWPQGHIRTFKHGTHRSNRRTTNVEAPKEKNAPSTTYEAKKCDQYSETTTIWRIKRIVDPTTTNRAICHQIRKDNPTTETIRPILCHSTSESAENLAPTAKSTPTTVQPFSMLESAPTTLKFETRLDTTLVCVIIIKILSSPNGRKSETKSRLKTTRVVCENNKDKIGGNIKKSTRRHHKTINLLIFNSQITIQLKNCHLRQ